MTELALVEDPAEPCKVCGGDPDARFKLIPLGFGHVYLADCPLCLPAEGSCGVWRSVLAPYLEKELA